MMSAGTYSNSADFDVSLVGSRNVVIEGLAGSKYTYIDCLQTGQGIQLGNGAPNNTLLKGNLLFQSSTINTNRISAGYLR